jgi:hypothetical protein
VSHFGLAATSTAAHTGVGATPTGNAARTATQQAMPQLQRARRLSDHGRPGLNPHSQCGCDTWKQATSYWETALPLLAFSEGAPLPAYSHHGACSHLGGPHTHGSSGAGHVRALARGMA